MTSKMVTDRQKTSRSLCAAIDTFGPQTVQAVGELCAPHLAHGETMPDLTLLFSLLTKVVQADIDALVLADAELARQHTKDSNIRNERDAANEAIVAALVEFGEVIDGLYGRSARPKVGLANKVSRDPVVVQEQARRVAQTVLDIDLTPRVKNLQVDLKPYSQSFNSLADSLGNALESLASNLRATDKAQVLKDSAMAHFQKSYLKVATLFEAFCRVADLDDLADRVRRSTNRHGTSVTPDDNT